MRAILVLTAVAVLCHSLPGSASEPVSRETVSYRGGLLSVDFEGMPVHTALLHLQRTAGITITAPASLVTGTIHRMTFRDLPLERGVAMVLRVASLTNYAVLYDAERGTPKTFVIVDSESGAVPGLELARSRPGTHERVVPEKEANRATVPAERLLARLVNEGAGSVETR